MRSSGGICTREETRPIYLPTPFYFLRSHMATFVASFFSPLRCLSPLPLSFSAFDLDGDGVAELVSGLANGKIEGRNASDGALLYTDKLRAPLVDFVAAGKP